MTPEGRVKKLVDGVLDDTACWYFKPVQTGYGRRALDYIVSYKGRFIAIETKRDGKDPTPFQRHTAGQMYLSGGHVWFIREPETVKTFARWLETL